MTQGELNVQAVGGRLTLAAWLTTERVAYGAAAILALFLRLFGLGLQLLNPAEAAQALPAWQAAQGHAYQLSGISPLLFGLQRWLFTPLAGSDSLARWWPALAGGLATLLFYALRDRLGRGGALVAAFLWAGSPLAVFVSRQATGYGLVPPLALALLACLSLALRTLELRPLEVRTPATRTPSAGAAVSFSGGAEDSNGRPPSGSIVAPLTWAAIALGALLAAGSGAYTVLLIGLVAALLWPGVAAHLATAVRGHGRSVLLAGGLSLILSATALFSAPAGFAVAGDLLSSWLRGLVPGLANYSTAELLLRLVLSEPLVLGFGSAGLVWALRRRNGFGLFAGLAAGLALLVAVVGGGRQPADLGLVGLPLILLAAPAVTWTLAAFWSWRAEIDPWLLFGLSLTLLVASAISLPSFYASTDAGHRVLYLGVTLITALLFVGLWVVYGVWGSWRTVRSTLPAVGLLVGVVWALSQLNSLNYDTDPLRRSGALLQTPGPGWVDLRAELRNLSALNSGGERDAPIDLVLPLDQADPLTPMLLWELRDRSALRVGSVLPSNPAPLVLTPADAQPAISDRYSGTSFDLLEEWRPESLTGPDLAQQWLRWAIYRRAATPPQATWKVVLWADRMSNARGFPQSNFTNPVAPVAPPGGKAQ
jgi:hypothetical protein